MQCIKDFLEWSRRERENQYAEMMALKAYNGLIRDLVYSGMTLDEALAMYPPDQKDPSTKPE